MHWRQVKQRLVPHEVRAGSHRSLRGGQTRLVSQGSAKDKEEKEQASVQKLQHAVVVGAFVFIPVSYTHLTLPTKA